MIIIQKQSLDDVLKQFYSEHDVESGHEHNTNLEASVSLLQADTQLGEWNKVYLDRDDVRRVILPHHTCEGGGVELVPRTGLTVKQAADKISAMRGRFAAECPACWEKITRARPVPIFLSTRANDVEDDYAHLDVKEGLIHLDGLHRMIGWELSGRLADGIRVEAYVAGPLPAALSTPTRSDR